MGEPSHYRSLDSFENETGLSIHLAIGMFDGLHLGHRQVVASAIEAASSSGGMAGVLTFLASSKPLVQSERSGTDDIELTNEIRGAR